MKCGGCGGSRRTLLDADLHCEFFRYVLPRVPWIFCRSVQSYSFSASRFPLFATSTYLVTWPAASKFRTCTSVVPASTFEAGVGSSFAPFPSPPAMSSASPEMAPADTSVVPPSTIPTTGSRSKIYTKTGDKGLSSLYDGQRRRKDDDTFEALGDVDEVNSALGFAHEYCSQASISPTVEQIEEIQSRLLDVGSAIATPLNSNSASKVARVKFDAQAVDTLERWIDEMDEQLPALSNFILPSGGLPAASLHLARSLCRRAERRVVTLVASELVEPSVSIYLNRLSDYLFTAARFTAMRLNKPETIWKKAR